MTAALKRPTTTTATTATVTTATPRRHATVRAAMAPVSQLTGPHTLVFDIGGTGLKATVLDAEGRMLLERQRIATPQPAPPAVLLAALDRLVASLPPFDRISIGFPGVVRDGRVLTAPHLGTEPWHGFALEAEATKRFGKPARLMNDAEVQGLGIVQGRGLEVVLTLGTGIGSAVFLHGRPTPHLELAHHPIHKGKTYDDYLGDAARRKAGRKRWNRRVRRMIGIVQSLLNPDLLYLGGGNSKHVDADIPENVRIASNDAGLTGGMRLWDERVWRAVDGKW